VALQRGNLISDYTFAKDELFAWLNLKDDELAMYGRVHAALGEKIPRPDLILYLRAGHDVLMRRIAHRDRPFERDIDPDYIREVAAAYDAWLSRLTDVPVLTVDTNDLDYLSRPADLVYVTEAINEALAHALPPAGSTAAGLRTLQQGRVAAFQQFHRELETGHAEVGNPFYRHLLLVEEMGELTAHLVRLWPEFNRFSTEGNGAPESRQQSLEASLPALRDDLADLLAHLLRLANDFGIDLEQAYLDKMRLNLGRNRPAEQRGWEQLPADRG
jgi:NTP pyrophosphatase (non-canonical NTP hydrolase)